MTEEPPEPEADEINFECIRCKHATPILEANIMIFKYFNQNAQAWYFCLACANDVASAINSVVQIFDKESLK